MKHLFIGGIADGWIIDVEEHQNIFRVPFPSPAYTVSRSQNTMTPTYFPYDEYVRNYLVSRQHREYSVFCAVKEDIDIVARLIEGYRRP